MGQGRIERAFGFLGACIRWGWAVLALRTLGTLLTISAAATFVALTSATSIVTAWGAILTRLSTRR